MNYRIEKDTMGDVKVPVDKYWGAKQRGVKTISRLEMTHSMPPRNLIYGLLS